MYPQVTCRTVIQNGHAPTASLNMQKLRPTFHTVSHLSLVGKVEIKAFKQPETNKPQEEA
jgi:hypothetical protein